MLCRSEMLTDIAPIVYKATKSGGVLDFIDFLCQLCYTRPKRKATYASRNSCENRGFDKSLFIMKALRDIIQRCHKQHHALLRQRRTVVTPILHKDAPYHFIVRCARGCPVKLYDLEQAHISFMPIGHAPESDHPPKYFGGERFLTRQGTRDWRPRRWFASWGIQIYTGTPSGRDDAQ